MSSRLHRLLSVVGALVLGAAHAAGAQPRFVAMPQVTTEQLRAVWGASSGDVFAVGANGVILHFDGLAWEPMDGPVPKHLYAVWGSAGDDVFATGQHGTILHYDGSGWTETTETEANWHRQLFGLTGFSSSDVFAVGGFIGLEGKRRVTLAHDGSEWSPIDYGDDTVLAAIWGSAPNDMIAVGGTPFDHAHALRFDGESWTPMPISSPVPLTAVWGTATDDVWAVGIQGMSPNGAIFHYSGVAWTAVLEQPVSFHGIWGSAGNDVYAVGTGGTILHFDGNQWRPAESGTTEDLLGVWGSAASDVFAVGSDGTIVRLAP